MPSSYVLGRLQQGGGTSLASAAAARAAVVELQQQARLAKLPKASKLVGLARELTPFLFGGGGGGNGEVDEAAAAFTLELAATLAKGGLLGLRDGDGDDARKAARLLYLLVSETVVRRAHRLLAADDGWQRIDAACAAVLEDASGGHILYAPRRILALRTLGVLIASSYSPPAAADRAHKALRELVFHAQEALQKGGGGALKGSKKKEHQDWLGIAAALASLIRRVIYGTDAAFAPPDWLSFLYSAMLGESGDASRAALAALAELARRRDDARTEMAIWLTTNRRLVGSTDGLPDTLQAIYYLRFCAAVAIPAAAGQLLSSTISEPFVRVLIQSVHDKRLRVWVEAVQLLYGGGAASVSFNRIMDTPTVGRVLSLALQEQTSAPALAAILGAIQTMGRFLHEAPAAGNLETIGQQPAAGPLLEAVLAKATVLQVAAPPPVRLACLLALVWLVPAPLTTTTDNDPVWASLEAQVLHSAAHLTDRQLVQVVMELLTRFKTSPPGPARAQLVQTLLGLVRALAAALPSGVISEAALQVWGTLWAAAEEERRRRAASAPYAGLLASVRGAAEGNTFSLPWELFTSALAVLDDGRTGPLGTDAAAGRQRGGGAARRASRVWQAQGRSGPPTAAEAKAVRARFHRLALRSLAMWAAQLPAGAEDALAGTVLLRLQADALYGDPLGRTAALGALCALAVGTASLDVKMAAYAFLAEIDGGGSQSVGVNGGPSGLEALAWQQQLAATQFDVDVSSGGLLVDGMVVATLAHLEEALGVGGAAAMLQSSGGLSVSGLEGQQQQAGAVGSEKAPASLLVLGE